MNKNEIIEIVNEFEKSVLTKFHFEKGDLKLAMEKEFTQREVEFSKENMKKLLEDSLEVSSAFEMKDGNENSESDKLSKNIYENKCEEEKNIVTVKTPIVGVFYAAPSPEDEPYVKVGDTVKAGQTLCLVEAMKMMNELKAPCDGTVSKIHGINGQLVEFDQVIFEVEPC